MRATKDCAYPVCETCQHPDCIMSGTDIRALLKRRQRQADPEAYRQKQRDYRSRIKATLPHCDGCESCVLVRKEKQDGYRRLCIADMRLIEQKVANSPQWCRFQSTLPRGERRQNCPNILCDFQQFAHFFIHNLLLQANFPSILSIS